MRTLIWPAAIVAVLVIGCSPAPTGERPASALTRIDAVAFAYPASARPFGRSMGDWNARWWRWELSVPAASNPGLDLSGAHCGEAQTDPDVWYLASTFAAGAVNRSCRVPAHRALLVALSTILNDYPCPDPNFRPAPGQSLQEFLTQGARQFEDAVNALNLTLDGQPLPSPFGYRFTTALIGFIGHPSLTAAIDPCITGTEQRAVSDGYFVMLKPLTMGHHVLQFGAADTRGFQSAITYDLTVGGDD